MRKIVTWKPEEASTLYWLILWGLKNLDVVELTKDLMPYRSIHSIKDYTVLVRKYISIEKGFDVDKRPSNSVFVILNKAKTIEPIKAIADLRPKDLTKVKFEPAATNSGGPRNGVKPNFEQVPEGYIHLNEKNYVREGIAKNKATQISAPDFVGDVEATERPEEYVPLFNISSNETLAERLRRSIKKDVTSGGAPEEQVEYGLPKDFKKQIELEFSEQSSQPKHPKQHSLEEVLKIAKASGATKVEWNGYIIKF